MKLELIGDKIALTINGFKILLKPMVAIDGRLIRPENIEIENNNILLKNGDRKCYLRFLDNSGTSLVEAECENGYTSDGIIIKMELDLDRVDKFLIYHFTYDIDGTWRDDEGILIYPQLRDLGENAYCAWSYPMHIDINKVSENIKISQILMYSGGAYCFLLPLSWNGVRGYITKFDGKLNLILNSYSKGRWVKAKIFSITVDENPYRAVYNAYKFSLEWMNRGIMLRENKIFPEIFRYIGWCSWNACWKNVSEEKILSIVNSILKRGINLKYVIIDDGWQDERNGMIRKINPLKDKFPRGFKPLIVELKKLGIKYVGLWHTLNIHWGGVDPQSALAEKYRKYLMEGYRGLIPIPSESFRLFNSLYRYFRSNGFNFVKVDNQSFVTAGYAGKTRVEYAARLLHEGLEAAAYVNKLDILNCMAQQPENIFNWIRSSISRNCIDYHVPHDKYRNRLHIYFNAYNSIWMSQLVWPDWDMFQSHDPWGLQQAVARAISGGPIYITDEYDKTITEIIKPLILSDGRILKPDIPAMPTLDSLMVDPYNEKCPLKIYSYIDVKGFGRYGLLAVFHIYKKDEEIYGNISPKDVNIFAENFLVYEYFSKKYWILDLSDQIKIKLNPMDVKLFIIAPLNKWIIPLGLEEKYIMPASIKKTYIFNDQAIIDLYEPNIFLLYTKEKISIDGGEILEKNGLIRIKCLNNIIKINRFNI